MIATTYFIQSLDKAYQGSLGTLKGVPSDRLTTQMEGAQNHFLWTIGHLACSMSFFASTLGVKLESVPESYPALFGMGSEPKDEPSKYPPLEELKAVYKAVYEEYRAAVEKLTDAQLAEKCVADGGGFVSNKGDAVIMCVFHTGWHVGQLSALRKGLGLGSMWG